SPATCRVGGPLVDCRKGILKQGMRWSGYDLKFTDSKPAPDTETPRAVAWLLPASDEKTVALVDTRNPDYYRARCFSFTSCHANTFVDTMDALIDSISQAAD